MEEEYYYALDALLVLLRTQSLDETEREASLADLNLTYNLVEWTQAVTTYQPELENLQLFMDRCDVMSNLMEQVRPSVIRDCALKLDNPYMLKHACPKYDYDYDAVVRAVLYDAYDCLFCGEFDIDEKVSRMVVVQGRTDMFIRIASDYNYQPTHSDFERACVSGHVDIVRQWLRLFESVLVGHKSSTTTLSTICRRNYVDILRLVLTNSVSREFITMTNIEHVVRQSLKEGLTEILKVLIDGRVDGPPTNWGHRPILTPNSHWLITACVNRQVDTVKMLLDYPHVVPAMVHSDWLARIGMKDIDVMKLWVSTNAITREQGSQCIHYAIDHQACFELIELLLDFTEYNHANQILCYAIKEGRLDIVKLLLRSDKCIPAPVHVMMTSLKRPDIMMLLAERIDYNVLVRKLSIQPRMSEHLKFVLGLPLRTKLSSLITVSSF